MSSEIYIHEDDQIALYFEIKVRGVWLYVHEEKPLGEDGLPSEDGAVIHSKRLTIKDLDNMIEACTAMRDQMNRVGYKD